MKRDSNLLWVAFQSNVLSDISRASNDFKQNLDDAKKELSKQHFVLPGLQYNMRNTKQMNNVKVIEHGVYGMQETIQKLECGNSSVVGEIPIVLKLKDKKDWNKKKKEILKHSIELIKKRNNKNIVLLHTKYFKSKDIQSVLEEIMENQTILTYPSDKGKERGKQNIKDFCETPNHILVTRIRYFNGCEAANVIFVNNYYDNEGVRNQMMRGVENFIFIDVKGSINVEGMKEEHF